MKHLLIILSFLLLSFPLYGQETGVLFSRVVNGKWVWFKESNGNVLEGKYLGEIHNGKPYGQGTYTSPDGRKYVGIWRDDKRNGQGTFTWSDGRKYVGRWKDDKRNGQGTFTSPDGQKYVGIWKDDKRNGEGTFTYPDGQKYVGEYKDGEPWIGTYDDKDGKIIFKYVNGVLQK